MLFYTLSTYCIYRIGYSIAKRLAVDGAKVVVSSRKQKNVDAAVTQLKKDGLDVTGMVCHVGNKQDRENLIEMVIAKHLSRYNLMILIHTFIQ